MLEKEQENDSVMKGYMTISFSYVYLKGLHLGIGPSSPVVIDVHRLNLQLAKTLQKMRLDLSIIQYHSKQIDT